jgi:EPTP domain
MDVVLTELQRIPTSGARAVETFAVGGHELLAVPQLALDVPGEEPAMNGGDSDTDLLLLRRFDERFVPFATLPASGGEDAEFFTLGDRSFLAVASIRSGSGPYRYATESTIFVWQDDGFVPFQTIDTFAAKQFKHWRIGDRHFLGLAQGVSLPGLEADNEPSVVFEWDGTRFVEFQRVESKWAYNWHAFRVGDAWFVAHAEHLGPSVLYRWDGRRLEPHQELMARAGRAFATFRRGDADHLVVAGLLDPVRVMRWRDGRFETIQELAGLGARELAVVEHDSRLLLIRVNFILGSPADPQPSLLSQVYEWDGGAFRLVAEFPTTGGTDVSVVDDGDDGLQFVVSNSLSEHLRFASETVLYSLS